MGEIYLKGMKIYAFHGCLKEENIIGSNYKIHLMVKTDMVKSSKSDTLIDTIDYSSLYKIIEKEMSIPSSLIENVCERILNALFNSFPSITKVSLEISKLNPPIDGDVKEVSIKKKRKRFLE